MQKACHETAAPCEVLLFAILGLFKKQSFLSRLQGLLLGCDFENAVSLFELAHGHSCNIHIRFLERGRECGVPEKVRDFLGCF